MLGHPGGEAHTRHMIGLAQTPLGSRWLDMGAGDGGTVRLLRDLGYCAQGIDLEPRGTDVFRGNYLESPWQAGFFDGIISQCSFYVSENVPDALKEAARLLHKGGKLVFSDVTENAEELLRQCREAGFSLEYTEDLTLQWREYYLEALWTQDNVCLPRGKKFRYMLFVCERM